MYCTLYSLLWFTCNLQHPKKQHVLYKYKRHGQKRNLKSDYEQEQLNPLQQRRIEKIKSDWKFFKKWNNFDILHIKGPFLSFLNTNYLQL